MSFLWDYYLVVQLVEFLILQICLGRRCLHNLVGFFFFLLLLSLSSSNSAHLPDDSIIYGETPIAGRTAEQERAWGGGRGERERREQGHQILA